MARQVAGREGVDVHHLLEQILLGGGRAAVGAARGSAPQQRAPQRRQRQRAPLGHRDEAVAVARRLAAEGHHASGAQHAPELAKRAGEIGQVVQHGVAEDEVAASRPPGRSMSSAAGSASSSSPSSSLTTMRSAWKVRFAGCPLPKRAGAGIAERMISTRSPVRSIGCFFRRRPIAREICFA